MRLEDITVEVRNKSLDIIGTILPQDLNLAATVLYNNVGTWKVIIAPEHPMASVLRKPGGGLVVHGPDDVLFSGPTIAPTFSADAGTPKGMLTIQGVTDEIHLADRMCLPTPLNLETNQTSAHDIRTGHAETVIRGFVNINAGPGARTDRRTDGLTLASDLGRGPIITKSARFDNLGSFIADIASGSELGFRVVQRGNVLVFEVYDVADLTSTIRLAVDNNTLSSQSVAVAAPTATQVIIAGQGDLTQRQMYVGNNLASLAAEVLWGRRIEKFVDQRQTDDVNEYATKAKEVLAAEGDTTIAVKVTPMDDGTMVFGKDWGLGDRVATVTDDGEYAAIASQLVLSASPSGFALGVGLGDLSRIDPTRSAYNKILDAAQRIDQLERRQ